MAIAPSKLQIADCRLWTIENRKGWSIFHPLSSILRSSSSAASATPAVPRSKAHYRQPEALRWVDAPVGAMLGRFADDLVRASGVGQQVEHRRAVDRRRRGDRRAGRIEAI